MPAASFDCYVLLDAQDWMNDADLTALWTQITRTARPGARVIFRTAADERLLPGRVPADLLDAWEYQAERSREFGRRDRSSIYGAFHLYKLVGRERMSEAAVLMDRMYRRQRHIYDATRKFYLLGRDAMIAELDARRGRRRARNRLRHRAQSRQAGAPLPRRELFRARRFPTRCWRPRARRSRGLDMEARIRLAQGDAASFDAARLFGRPRFERVIISYALSMIPPWREALGQAVDALAPGGSLHIVDFGDCAGLPAPFSAALNRWLALFDVTPRVSVRAELEALSRARGLRCQTRNRLRGYAIQAVIE